MHRLALVLLIATASQFYADTPCGSYWSGGLLWQPMPGHHHPAFEIIGASCEDGHLYGMFMYRLDRFPDEPPPAKEIRGVAKDEKFWPNVTLELGPSVKGPWKKRVTSRRGSDTMRGDKSTRYRAFHVEMDSIAPFIGKGQFARVVLESGEAALIDIDQNYNHPSN